MMGWPATGRLLECGPLPERFPGQYSDEAKAAWQPWIDAARAGASVGELEHLAAAIALQEAVAAKLATGA